MIKIQDLEFNPSKIWGGLAQPTPYKWEFSDSSPPPPPLRFDLKDDTNAIKVELVTEMKPCFKNTKFELDHSDICSY
jgi:hypothetical protein